MMKRIILLTIIAIAILSGACHDKTIGFLSTEKASYKPDTMYIRKTPDPVEDAVRMETKAPWMSVKLQGYKGTQQIYFDVESVTSESNPEAARAFMKDLTILGGGSLLYPFENDAVPGAYKVSVRLTNPGYSKVIENALTIIVTE